VESPP
jgi:hypothetical protein